MIVAADKESSDVTSAPFATIGSDGSLAVMGVAAGSTDYIVVEPPHSSAQAGIIRLAGR